VTSLLLLGFLIGLHHALEADHVAAVASLATQSRSVAHTMKQGAVWGLGHAITLFIFGLVALLMDSVIPSNLAHGLEFAVGVMLIILGIDVLRRLLQRKIHFHIHTHESGKVHLHAHSHVGESGHHPFKHHHEHPNGFPVRALVVGLMHGMAGSAALILLTLESVHTPVASLTYIALFGAGSVLGMAALSVIIAIPLRRSAKGLTRLHNVLQSVIGVATITLGTMITYRVGFVDGVLS
jgi:cytochrome c biogenesis protein CcdA